MSVKFVVQGQNLYKFSKEPILADKSVEFVELEFTFSSEWDGTSKTAQFIQDDKVYSQILNDNRCYLPQELNEGSFYLSVFGYKGSKRATARKLQMSLEDSGFSQGEVPIPPTPDLYAQLLVKIDEAVKQAEQAVKDAQSAVMNMSVSATEFTIQAMKGSFLFPVGSMDIGQGSLSGELKEVPYARFYTRSNGESILVYVSGDGTINLG